jgi:peptidase E
MEESSMADVPANGQIVAIGGAALDPSLREQDMALYRYLLALTGKERPKALFVPTASAEAPTFIINFFEIFVGLGAVPAHLSFFKPPTADLRGFTLEHDLIYVGGGNTKSMLALWREWGFDAMLREAWGRGVVLAGLSAGSICWFEQGITDSIPGPLTPLDCLGFLPGTNCPHYDGEAERRPTFTRLLREGQLRPGLAAEDGVGLHFVGDRLERVVTSRPGKRAYRLELRAGEVVETPLAAESLV